MAQEYLLGAVLMWLLLLVVTVGITGARDWRRGGVTATGTGTGWRRGTGDVAGAEAGGVLDRLQGRPLTAALLVIGAGVGVGIAAVAAVATSGDASGIAGSVVIGGVGLMLGVYVIAGIYLAARVRGHGSAAATAISTLLLGLLLLVAITVQLVTA